ncbi:hypothetical protein QR685DRAFT_536934 [Neurospora intermedia]|uniref:Uncharacterized protein n=1 Tax=Neurospora intermedia TaxID=5142 RepID=A0ABR3D1A6_NEUIN
MEPNTHPTSSKKGAPGGTESIHQQTSRTESATESHGPGFPHGNQPASDDETDVKRDIAGDHLIQEDTSAGKDPVKSSPRARLQLLKLSRRRGSSSGSCEGTTS